MYCAKPCEAQHGVFASNARAEYMLQIDASHFNKMKMRCQHALSLLLCFGTLIYVENQQAVGWSSSVKKISAQRCEYIANATSLELNFEDQSLSSLGNQECAASILQVGRSV